MVFLPRCGDEGSPPCRAQTMRPLPWKEAGGNKSMWTGEMGRKGSHTGRLPARPVCGPQSIRILTGGARKDGPRGHKDPKGLSGIRTAPPDATCGRLSAARSLAFRFASCPEQAQGRSHSEGQGPAGGSQDRVPSPSQPVLVLQEVRSLPAPRDGMRRRCRGLHRELERKGCRGGTLWRKADGWDRGLQLSVLASTPKTSSGPLHLSS
ncbi:uncharacterized protein LOC115292444 [Suricata suricatta]|uniref:uncharacterized protein LOC115292444 n=1 Tax=Suricata suricatta TaxID=37032 RepID=UPI001155DF55|nr:uncharacterized protein LOC115292444 [Suricata suricatta]